MDLRGKGGWLFGEMDSELADDGDSGSHSMNFCGRVANFDAFA